MNGEWGKWEVTANNGLEYGKIDYNKGTRSSSSANWVSNGEYTSFADPEAVTEIFDPAELVDRLDQIDLDQETQNDRLDQIDLDQEERTPGRFGTIHRSSTYLQHSFKLPVY